MPIIRRIILSMTACGVCLVVLAVVVWRWDVSGEHSVRVAVLAVVVWSWDVSGEHSVRVE